MSVESRYDEEDRRVGSTDRREERSERREKSAWTDPRLWVAVCALLLTIGLAVLGYIAAQLQAINSSTQSTRDMVLQVTSRQTAEIQSIDQRLGKLEALMATQVQAYNFNFTSRLAAVEAKAGVRSPKQED